MSFDSSCCFLLKHCLFYWEILVSYQIRVLCPPPYFEINTSKHLCKTYLGISCRIRYFGIHDMTENVLEYMLDDNMKI